MGHRPTCILITQLVHLSFKLHHHSQLSLHLTGPVSKPIQFLGLGYNQKNQVN